MTAQSGIWGFGPQVGKGTPPSTWYRHAALAIAGGVNDEATVGPPEISGLPVPTAPHKTGYSVAGQVTYQPRFVDVFGWILHAVMGDYDGGTPGFDEDYLHAGITLTAAPQPAYTTGLGSLPVATGLRVSVSIAALGGADFSGSITVNGTDLGDAPETDTFVFTNGILYETIKGTVVFKTVTSVDLPAYTNDGDVLSIGMEDGVDHLFRFDPADTSAVKWVGMRKYIPQVNAVATSDLLEEYTDAKMLSFMMTAQNRGLLQAQTGFIGRDFSFGTADPGDWANTIESFESMPVSVKAGGYFRMNPDDLTLTNQTLPLINAQVGITNTPVQQGVDRIYGDPRLYTMEIASRAVQFQVTMRWEDPEFYRAVVSNNINGTAWSEVPLVGSIDFVAESIKNMTGGYSPYSLRMQAPKVLFTLQSAVPLVGNNVVLASYTGVAVNNPGGEYATITLKNKKAAGSYAWPT